MSSYRIRRTASANNDLLEAWLYVAEESLSAADRLLDMIDADIRSLLEHPRMGRKRDELGKDLRSWPTSTPYIVFYFLQNHDIIIARVLHHARDVLSVETWPNR